MYIQLHLTSYVNACVSHSIVLTAALGVRTEVYPTFALRNDT